MRNEGLLEELIMNKWNSSLHIFNAAFIAAIGFALASVPLDYLDATERFHEKPIAPEIANENIITLTGHKVEGIGTAEFIDRYRSETLKIVDLRTQEKYAEGHLAGSINIPEDTMEQRAANLFDKNARIFVFCNYNPSCEVADAGHGVLSRCQRVAQKFRFFYGYRNAVLIQSNIKELAAAGVTITGSSRPKLVAGTSDGGIQR